MSRSPESSLTNAPTPEGVFRGVAADDWQTWLAQGEILSLGAGDVLFQEGDPGDAVYLVIDGHLQIRVTRPDGSVIVLADGYMANASEPWAIPDVDKLEKFPVKFRTEKEGFHPFLRDPIDMRSGYQF